MTKEISTKDVENDDGNDASDSEIWSKMKVIQDEENLKKSRKRNGEDDAGIKPKKIKS